MKLTRNDLHKYQVFAAEFIKNNPTAAVFLDCGLGKTIITLTAIADLMLDSFTVKKVLVVAPLRVCNVWATEIKNWEHTSDIRYSMVAGNPKQRIAALETDADIYIISRDNLHWMVEKSHAMPYFDMAVLDELSSFKALTQRTKAFCKLRPMLKRVVGLTGTPSSNGLMDLFYEFKCLDMGKRLGRFIGQYRLNYFTPGRRNGEIIYEYNLMPDGEERIYKKISDITISMKAVDHLDMPELLKNEQVVRLNDKELENYESLKKELVLSLPDGEVTAANAASLAGKLSQMANGAVYDDSLDKRTIEIHDKKLDALEDLLEAANGKPVLVAYWFKHDRERIIKRLQKLKVSYVDIKKQQDIDAWNTGNVNVGLLHPASAGHGLNLQYAGASTIIWFGLTWSLELYQQTVARLWRQGQKERTVLVKHIVTEGTIDERIIKALNGKADVQNALIDAVRCELGGKNHGA